MPIEKNDTKPIKIEETNPMKLDCNENTKQPEPADKNIQQLNLINNLCIALKEYKRLVNENREKNTDKYSFQNDISNPLSSAQEMLAALKKSEINLEHKDKLALLRRVKTTIENVDQLVRDEYLPTRLHKIHEAIKTLLRHLIALFAPLEGSRLINKTTLTSTRSTLFSDIKTLQKSLTPIPEPQTEAPMIGLPQPRM